MHFWERNRIGQTVCVFVLAFEEAGRAEFGGGGACEKCFGSDAKQTRTFTSCFSHRIALHLHGRPGRCCCPDPPHFAYGFSPIPL